MENRNKSVSIASGAGPSPITNVFRFLLCLFILIISISLYYPLCLRLMSGLYLLRAGNEINNGSYGLAVARLNKAGLFAATDEKIFKNKGKAYQQWGERKNTAVEAWPLAIKAKENYLKAIRLNPLDAEAVFGLAMAEARLESLFLFLYPNGTNSPFNAMPMFREVFRLSPNSAHAHYAMALYLFQANHEDELLTLIQNLMRIYPQGYGEIRKEPFWSLSVMAAARQGLEQALEMDIQPRDALKALSSIEADQRHWARALALYRRALQYRSFENRTGDLIHLGLLSLRNGEIEGAEKSFSDALMNNPSRERDLKRIYSIYKDEDRLEMFRDFYELIRRRLITTTGMDILFARSFIDLKEYDRARKLLMDINTRGQRAEAYYLLALIAEVEEDWDGMDLLIHKATVLEPENSNYHLIFAKVLKRLNKLEMAEKEAGLALKYSVKPSPWLLNERAWIRWELKDFSGACKDWQAAARLKPEYAPFYACAAEAYARLAYWSIASEYYLKALKIDPSNTRYQKRYSEIKDNYL